MRSVQAGRIAHAYLIAGGRGTGKRTLANVVAQSLFCTAADKPCDLCPACKRFVAGSHPDFRTITPKGKSIGVDEVRQLIDWLAIKPYEGGFRAVIVEEADKMTLNAQNALLKTLEEPGDRTVFFLLAESPNALLPTVRSRSRIVKVEPLPPELCADALVSRGIEESRARTLAGFSRGAVGRALEIAADEGFFPLYQRVLASLSSLKGPGSVAEAAGGFSEEKERSGDVLEMLEIIGRDRMAVENGAPAEACDPAAIRNLTISGSALFRGVLRAREMLFSNVAWASVLDQLYFSLTEG